MMAAVLAVRVDNARNGRRAANPPIPVKPDTYLCPGCGDDVPIGPRGCPRCTKPPKPRGKAQRRSWEQDRIYDDLDLPDQDFDYDEFVAREFGNVPHRRIGIAWYWWVTALVLLVLIIAGYLNRVSFL
jgi:hypothetical protein